MAVAYRAGAELSDVEFVQFHPTVLVSPSDPRPLISEAVRGEGAILRDAQGAPVMEGVHPLRDLAPRDVVSRAMVALMRRQGVDHLYLDARLIARDMPERFPTITAVLRRLGIDPAREMIPVSPASHYTIGGIRTSIDGETSVDGLYAVGEVASVGIHGANRLASNSLLEGVVFGRRIARHIESVSIGSGHPQPLELPRTVRADRPRNDRMELRREMDRFAGVVRTGVDLRILAEWCEARLDASVPLVQEEIETYNMALVGNLLAVSAFWRTESRGAHFRSDTPQTVPEWARRQVVQRDEDGTPLIGSIGLGAIPRR
jgi:aspartate oxidase